MPIRKEFNMKKNIILSILCMMMILVTGCSNASSSTTSNTEPSSLKYTWWQDTDGYELWLLDDECVLRKDNKNLGNVCSFTDNAYGTEKSKITICNNYGTSCSTTDVPISFAQRGHSITTKYGSYYYQGPIEPSK